MNFNRRKHIKNDCSVLQSKDVIINCIKKHGNQRLTLMPVQICERHEWLCALFTTFTYILVFQKPVSKQNCKKTFQKGHEIAAVLNWDLNVQKEETQPVHISGKAYRWFNMSPVRQRYIYIFCMSSWSLIGKIDVTRENISWQATVLMP